jgi:hypothetical protein
MNSLQQVQLRQRNKISLRNTQISSEYQIAAGGSVAAAKQNFAAQHTNWQRISNRCRRFSCVSETKFRCETHKSAANINSLQQVQLRQRNTQIAAQHTNRQRISNRCGRFSCSSETEFRCATHKLAANIKSQ